MTQTTARSSQQNGRPANVPPALASRLVGGQINLAEFVGLRRATLYAIAGIAYQLLNSGRIEQARLIYRGLVAADPYDSVFRCHLAAAHQRLGELDEALAEYTAALRFNYANVDALAGRSEILLQRGRIDEAVRDLRAVLTLDPKAERATTLRARAVLQALRTAAAQTTGQTSTPTDAINS
ncbi:MAG TPA: tetratricopeptide repeat protein [Pyrinomonadaceae bacterium]|nr:tetratricopeptide repeat protein [Pyrinomonadaceae bacterium]